MQGLLGRARGCNLEYTRLLGPGFLMGTTWEYVIAGASGSGSCVRVDWNWGPGEVGMNCGDCVVSGQLSTESQTHAPTTGLCFSSEPRRFQKAPAPNFQHLLPSSNWELVLVAIIIEIKAL